MAAVSGIPSQVAAYCDQAGMRSDSPLRLALLATCEAAEAARSAAAGARGLTPEGEAALVRRVAETAAESARQETAGLAAQLQRRTALIASGAALALLGIGFLGGRWSDTGQVQALQGAGFIAQIAEANNPQALREHCLAHAFAQGSGTACTLPPVWIRAP